MHRSQIVARFEQHGIIPTAQRLEVAAILLEKPQHMSAEQIIEQLRAKGRKISKATVYNCLKIFGNRGLVKKCLVDPERLFYDSTTTPHHHFFNVDTQELSDIPADTADLIGMPDLPPGTVLEGAELVIRVRNSAE